MSYDEVAASDVHPWYLFSQRLLLSSHASFCIFLVDHFSPSHNFSMDHHAFISSVSDINLGIFSPNLASLLLMWAFERGKKTYLHSIFYKLVFCFHASFNTAARPEYDCFPPKYLDMKGFSSKSSTENGIRFETGMHLLMNHTMNDKGK